MRILPYLYEYFKTNYFTLICAVLIGACFLFRRLSGGRFLGKIPSMRKQLFWVLAVFCLGTILRLGWIGICRYEPAFQWSDATEKSKNLIEQDGINIYAASITKGSWFRGAEGEPLARRPVGYPTLLGAVYSVFGTHLTAFHVLNFLLYLATLPILYALAREMFDDLTGLLVVFIFSIYPVSVYGMSLALDEHLFVPLWYGGIWLLIRQANGSKIKWPLLWYGLIFGCATATRTHSFFMPLIVGFVYFRLSRSWKKVLLAAAVVYLIGQAVIFPWIWRNYQVWGIYVPYTATNHDVYHGCNASVTQADNNGHWPEPGEPGYNETLSKAIARYDVATFQPLAAREVSHYILTHPWDVFVTGIEKSLHFLGANRKTGVWAIDLMEESKHYTPELKLPEEQRRFFEELAFGAYYIVFYSFLFGAISTLKTWKALPPQRKNTLLISGLCFAGYLGLHFLLYPERKYRYPLEPFMMIVASHFLLWAAGMRRPETAA
ncbi:MAG: hypothetical protein A3C47_04730 [Omnitrophica bacterium RIFCSPHIGHO2_02_FULL_51_18]|nr:MAG: hypothetical protein A3C47_04730 [Omnitrophica bacterium RIFCSPHIGHO2_02_FULL_51_18]